MNSNTTFGAMNIHNYHLILGFTWALQGFDSYCHAQMTKS